MLMNNQGTVIISTQTGLYVCVLSFLPLLQISFHNFFII